MAEQPDTQKDVVQVDPSKLKIQTIETSVPSLYINHAQFSMSEWDIRIDLGEQHSIEPDPAAAGSAIMFAVPKLRLIMTPSYARLFAKVLNGVMEKRTEAEEKMQSEKTKPATG